MTEVVFKGTISLNFNSVPPNVVLFGEHALECSSSDIKMGSSSDIESVDAYVFT